MSKRMTRKGARRTLERLADLIEQGGPDASELVARLNDMLDGALGDDLFGTEGQLDPRGDRRNED